MSSLFWPGVTAMRQLFPMRAQHSSVPAKQRIAASDAPQRAAEKTGNLNTDSSTSRWGPRNTATVGRAIQETIRTNQTGQRSLSKGSEGTKQAAFRSFRLSSVILKQAQNQ